jgi:hypothetical protein
MNTDPKKTTAILIKMSEEEKKALAQKAKKKQISMSQLVRDAAMRDD